MNDILGRRVRWPVEPVFDQSLIGLVVSTAKHNLHDNIGTILAMAGIPHARGLGLAMRDADRRAALAHALDQPIDEVVRRAHLPVHNAISPNGVDFFGACVPSHDVHHGVRRVGATNDPEHFYHRALWQLVRVPIDVSADFRVTSTCMSCGVLLGWRNTTAAQRCDDCGRTVNDNTADADPAAIASARTLAALVDPRPCIHVAARDALHPALQNEDRGVVFYLGYRLGLALTKVQTLGRIGAGQSLGFEDGVAVLDLGARLISQWPNGIADLLREQASDCPHDALNAARAVRRLATSETEWPQHRLLMNGALPSVHRSAKAFLGSLIDDAHDTKGAAAFLGIEAGQVSQLHRAKALPALMENTGGKIHALFSKAALEDVRNALDDQMSLGSAAHALGISRHGVEQLACCGVFVRCVHKAVGVLYAGVRISRGSVAAFVAALEAKQQPSVRSFAPVISLRQAGYITGGREKAWGVVFAALINGDIKFTMSTSTTARMVDQIMIDPDDAAELFAKRFERNDYPEFPFVADMARREAAELLNLNQKTAICFDAFPTECHVRGKRLAIASMLRIAASHISPLEIKARWGLEHPFGLGEKTELGWSRINAEGAYGTSRPRSIQETFDFSDVGDALSNEPAFGLAEPSAF